MAGFLITRKNLEIWDTVDKKEHKLYFLFPLSYLILTKTGLVKLFHQNVKVKNTLQSLYVTKKSDILQRIYWCSKISYVILILFLFHFLSLFYHLGDRDTSKLFNERFLRRPNYGKGSEEIELTLHIAPSNSSEGTVSYEIDSQNNYTKDFKIKIEEPKYTFEERMKIFDEAKKYIDYSVLGENQSAEHVDKNLYFCDKIPKINVAVEWRTDDSNLISRNGKVNNENIDAEGIITTITAILYCQGYKLEYSMPIKIMPKDYSNEERLYQAIEKELSKYAEHTSSDKHLELPNKIGNYKLFWEEKKSKTGFLLFILGILAAILVWFYQDQELEKKMKDRNKQLMLDFPEIINKFNLLVNAGMTMKQAWSKITEDYQKKRSNMQQTKRYAYEEMLVTVHELRLGITEGRAYEQYGRRIGLLPYMKFSSLIAQNLKKGNKGLIELLNRESMEAFENRKEAAKRIGEEAGTKLLAPMMIMLVIVLFIILIPAFISFGV